MTYMDNFPLPKNYWAGFRRKNKHATDAILAKLQPLGVLEGLSEGNQDQLANLVLMISLQFKVRTKTGLNEKYVRAWLKRGPGQLNRLRSNVQKFKDAFENLKAHVASVNASGNLYLTEVLDDKFQLRERLAEIGNALQKLHVPPASIFEAAPPRPRMSADDPTIPATKVLADFFTAECGLTTNDASRLIAKIENVMWRGNLREDDPDSYTPARSRGVLKRLRRHPRSPAR